MYLSYEDSTTSHSEHILLVVIQSTNVVRSIEIQLSSFFHHWYLRRDSFLFFLFPRISRVRGERSAICNRLHSLIKVVDVSKVSSTT